MESMKAPTCHIHELFMPLFPETTGTSSVLKNSLSLILHYVKCDAQLSSFVVELI